MHCFLVYFLLIFTVNVEAQDISEVLRRYFNSQIVMDFNAGWKKVSSSCEINISVAFKKEFFSLIKNAYLSEQSPQLVGAYFLSDDIVNLLLLNLTLKNHIPRLRSFMPEVNLVLSDNLIRVQADLEPIFIEANYSVFRNKSNILYEANREFFYILNDPYKNTPFTLSGIQNEGKLIIVAEGCKLAGYATVMLKNISVSLGYTSFQVTNCHFRIEIYNAEMALPFVMVPYFTVEQGRLFEKLLSKLMSKEIIPKLQTILLDEINTTAIFETKVGDISIHQDQLSRKIQDFMTELVLTMNNVTSIEKLTMKGLQLTWDDMVNSNHSASNIVVVTDIILKGLKTAYSVQMAGAYRHTSMNIADEIRFEDLLVSGTMYIGNATYKEISDFSISLCVSGSIQLSFSEKRRFPPSFSMEIVAWRDLEFDSVRGMQNSLQYLVLGYLIDQVPKVIHKHLTEALTQALASLQAPKYENFTAPGNVTVIPKDDSENRMLKLYTVYLFLILILVIVVHMYCYILL